MKPLKDYICESKKYNDEWKETMANDIDDSNLLDICHYMIQANNGINKGVSTIYIPYEDLEKYFYTLDENQLNAEYDSLLDLISKDIINQIIVKNSLSRSGKQHKVDILAQCYIDMLRWMYKNDEERLKDIWPRK